MQNAEDLDEETDEVNNDEDADSLNTDDESDEEISASALKSVIISSRI